MVFCQIVLTLPKGRGKSAEKTLHDDFVLACIHLTESPQSAHSCLLPVGKDNVL